MDMKYVILVSHGTFAPGLHSVLKMLAGGDRSDIISASMEDDMGADDFIRRFEEVTRSIKESDEIILLADIIGGSPLTNALDFLSQKGLLSNAIAFGGMNLPMALTAAMMKDGMDQESLRSSLLIEAKNAMMEMELRIKEEEDEI
jgi:PTS system N-acetylgalactosamine-specific IIA component